MHKNCFSVFYKMILDLPHLHKNYLASEVRDGIRSLLSQLRDVMVHYHAKELSIKVPLETREEHHSKIIDIEAELFPKEIHFQVKSYDYISSTEADLTPDGDVFLHRPPTLETRHVERVSRNRKKILWLMPNMTRREGWPHLQKHDFGRLYHGLQKLSYTTLPATAHAPGLPNQKFEIQFRFIDV